MWDTTVSPCSWEPIELRSLKQELATLTCKCNACESNRHPSLHNLTYQNDEAVQVEQKTHLLHKYIYASSEVSSDAGSSSRINLKDYYNKDIFCPNCYFIWDLLRRITKVFKDEGSEIKPELSDKATEKPVSLANSTTAIIPANNKTVLNIPSNLTLSDFISDCTSESSLLTRNDNQISNKIVRGDKKKAHRDRVTFFDDYPLKEETKKEPQALTMHGNCFCLDNLMDSIRPPLTQIF